MRENQKLTSRQNHINDLPQFHEFLQTFSNQNINEKNEENAIEEIKSKIQETFN